MTSKKSLKKKYKSLKRKVSELQNTSTGIIYAVANMIRIYDGNMDLIEKTFEAIVQKIKAIENRSDPLSILDKDVNETDKTE